MYILLLNFIFRFTANCCLVDIIFFRWFAFNPIYVLVSFYASYIMFYVLHLPPFRGHVYFFLQFQYEPVFSLLAPISFYCVYFICNVRYTAITKFYVVLICIYIFFLKYFLSMIKNFFPEFVFTDLQKGELYYTNFCLLFLFLV